MTVLYPPSAHPEVTPLTDMFQTTLQKEHPILELRLPVLVLFREELR